jgi:hypothetical protein
MGAGTHLAGPAPCGRWWWRIIARDAVVFPETVALTRALLDPAMQDEVPPRCGGC